MTSESEKSWLIEAWTDGSSKGVVGPGGWAYVMTVNGKFVVQDSGPAKKTTNQRMEMMAAIMALRQCVDLEGQASAGWRVKIHSDSAYLINGMTERWYEKWETNGWRNAQGRAVKNRDLWEMLAKLQRSLDAEWVKVKGHIRNPKNISQERNSRADAMANAAMRQAERSNK